MLFKAILRKNKRNFILLVCLKMDDSFSVEVHKLIKEFKTYISRAQINRSLGQKGFRIRDLPTTEISFRWA